jgi:hypothetical protein
MTTTEIPYLEAFGCFRDDGEDHDHEGDCDWGFYCAACSRPVNDGPCPVHAPRDIPGLVLAECDATPRHPHTWFYATEGYPPPCMYCSWDALNESHRGCEHSHHRPWRRWKATRWLASRGYTLGVTSGHSISWGAGCDGCVTGVRPGRSPYVLFRQREWWSCLLRRRHLFRPVDGLSWMCDRCNPDPGEQA